MNDMIPEEARVDIIATQALNSNATAATAAQTGYVVINEFGMSEVIPSDVNLNTVFEIIQNLAKKIGNEQADHVVQAYLTAKRFQGEQSLNNDRQRKAQEYKDEAARLRATRTIRNSKRADNLIRLSKKMELEGTKITEAQADGIAPGLALAQQYPELGRISNLVTQFQNRNVDLLEQTGVISKEEADEYRSRDWYVPLNRVFEEGEVNNNGSKEYFRGFSDIGQQEKFRGSERQIDNVLNNLLSKHFWSVNAALRNNAHTKAANYVGITEKEADGVTEVLDESGKPILVTYNSKPKNKITAPLFIDGEMKYVEYSDPLYAIAVQGPESPLIETKLFARAANLLRTLITANPIFQTYQVFNDSISAAAYSGVNRPFELMGRVMTSYAEILADPNSPIIQQMRRAGITGGYGLSATEISEKTRRQYGLDDNNVKDKTLDFFDNLASYSDLAQRKALFEQSLLETGGVRQPDGTIVGGNQILAINRALNIINWQQRGSSPTVRLIAHTVPFANAYLQGMEILAKVMSGKFLTPLEKKKARNLFFVTGLKMMALNLMYSMLVSGEDDYEERDEREKLRFYIVPGTGFRLPVRAELSLLFKAAPELAYDIITKQGTDNAYDARRIRQAISTSIGDAMAGPNLMPQLFKPTIEVITNHNFFTGRDIVASGYRKQETELQFNESTSEFSKMLGQTGIVSPLNADHFIKGTLGTVGSLSLYLFDSMANLLYDNKLPTTDISRVPGIGTIMYSPNGRNQMNQFYDFKEVSDRVTSSLNNYIDQGDKVKVRKYAKDNAKIISLRGQVNRIDNQLEKIRDIRKAVIKSTRLSANEKRERLNKLDKAMNNIVNNISKLRNAADLPIFGRSS